MKISLEDNEEWAEEIYPEISLKIFSVEDNVELGNRTAAAAASFERKLSDTHILTISFDFFVENFDLQLEIWHHNWY